MQKRTLTLWTTPLLLCGALLTAGCPDGEVEDAMEDTGEAVDEAVDNTKDALEEAGDNIEDATDGES